MNIEDFLEQKLNVIKKADRYRKQIVQKPLSANRRLVHRKELIQFSSNDYLGLSFNERLIDAGIEAAKEYGIGATGSRLITGTTELHSELEKQLAEFKGTESALFFNSGYDANIAVLSSILSNQDVVYFDELNHSSILSGIELSGAEKVEYKHLSIQDLEQKLKTTRHKARNALIVTETVFGMDGDIVDLKGLCELSEKYDCWLMVDEAHSTGVFADDGGGLAKKNNLHKKIDIQMGTCSKALGVQGAYIAGSETFVDYLRQRARTFIYSTATSPFIIGALIESIKICTKEQWRREKLFENVSKVIEFLEEKECQIISKDSQIICLEFKSIEEALKLSERLMKEGLWVQAIRPPTVKSPRLRINVNSLHSEGEITRLLEALTAINNINS